MDLNSPVCNVKCQKMSEEWNLDEGRNRIGNLPEGILLHILSFLPTKDSVKTSILSKRWQYLWMSVTNLEFSDDGVDNMMLFMNFVERVLMLRDSSNIHKFSLSCDASVDASRIDTWISAAVRHKVKVLDLRLEPSDLPSSLFTCESLTELELVMIDHLMLPSVICFSSLKIMTLTYVTFCDDHLTGLLFSGCPVLEKLTLDDCGWQHVKSVCISAPMLRSLAIFGSPEDDCKCKVVINETSLKSFTYKCELRKNHGFFYEPSRFPCSLYTCESLEVLELEMFHDLLLPSVICFSSLKIITLRYVIFRDDHLTGWLFSGCPVLVKLTLDECDWQHVKFVCISAPMLRNLAIFESLDNENNCEVVIIGTCLKSFNYGGGLKNVYCFQNSSSIVDAYIDVDNEKLGRQREVADRAHNLLKGLSSVRELILTYNTVKVLNFTEELLAHLPMFYNLKLLKLTSGSVNFACRALMKLLQHSPSLSTMRCVQGISLTSYGENDDWTLDPVPPCFSTHFKTIEIWDFYGTQGELDVIKNLLISATALEKMCLIFVGGLKEKYEFIKQLEVLPSERLDCVCVHDDPKKGS